MFGLTQLVAGVLTAAAVATAPTTAEAITPTYRIEGVVSLKWYDASTPEGPLGLPTGPECYGLKIEQAWTAERVCVSREDWNATGFLGYFRGEVLRNA